MRLLILTQKIDSHDDLLGFFHRWVEEFAKRCESVTVVCLFEGEHRLPKNVRVFSLGKERGVSRIKYIGRFFSYIWRERKSYDTVFVHMNPIYAVLGGVLWRLWRKRTALWYVHGHVDIKLRLAVALVHRVFTAVPASFPLVTPKLACVGHGIDMETFRDEPRDAHNGGTLQLLHVGRISAKKHILQMLEVARILKEKNVVFSFVFVGTPATPADEVFYAEAREYVASNGLGEYVMFRGAVPNIHMPDVYRAADYLLHLSSTGGLDKVVIESWCVGTPAFTDQVGFAEYFGRHRDTFFISDNTSAHLADAVLRHHSDARKLEKEAEVQKIMRDSFAITNLISRVVGILEERTRT